MRILIALFLAALALTACGVRIDSPDPTPEPPSSDEILRQREALRAEALAALDPAGDPDVTALTRHAAAHVHALGGVWRAWPAGDGPSPTVDPTPDVAVGPDGVLPWLRATESDLRTAVLDADDGSLATLFASIAVSRAVDADNLARAAGAEPALPHLPEQVRTTSSAVVRALDAAAHALEEQAAQTAAAGGDHRPLARAAEQRRALAEQIVQRNGWAGTPRDPREPFYGEAALSAGALDRDLALVFVTAVGEEDQRGDLLDAALAFGRAAARAGEDLGALPGIA